MTTVIHLLSGRYDFKFYGSQNEVNITKGDIKMWIPGPNPKSIEMVSLAVWFAFNNFHR